MRDRRGNVWKIGEAPEKGVTRSFAADGERELHWAVIIREPYVSGTHTWVQAAFGLELPAHPGDSRTMRVLTLADGLFEDTVVVVDLNMLFDVPLPRFSQAEGAVHSGVLNKAAMHRVDVGVVHGLRLNRHEHLAGNYPA